MLTAGNISFTHCPMWVQVWGLPFDLFSEEVGQDIGLELGQVVEVDYEGLDSSRNPIRQASLSW